MSNAIKVLLIDDSSLVRKMVRKMLESDPEIEVTGEVDNGRLGLAKIKTENYDVAILDFEMPEMNGLEFLKALRQDKTINNKPEIIVFSSLTKSGSKHTIDCLLAGAKDYVLKPEANADLDSLKQTIIDKIKSFGKGHRKAQKAKETTINNTSRTENLVTTTTKDKLPNIKLKNPGLVLIGSSTGGPAALEASLKNIPADYPYPILIVQHMPANFTSSLVASLNKSLKLPVVEVLGPTKIERSKIYLACGGLHTYMRDKDTLDVRDGELVSYCKPSVDVLFKSVADLYQKSVLAIILTGMGHDGAAGVAKLKSRLDTFCIIQDEESSVVWGMPSAVHSKNLHDLVVPLDKIGDCILNARYTSTIRG